MTAFGEAFASAFPQLAPELAVVAAFERWAEARLLEEVYRPPGEDTSLLAYQVMIYLNCNLLRCQSMVDGIETAIKAGNLLLSCLALRAQIECLGGVAYLRSKLEAYYGGNMSRPVAATVGVAGGGRSASA